MKKHLSLKTIIKPIDSLKSSETRSTFMDLVELRQRIFEGQNSKILCLDKYDLISSHLVLYYKNDPVSYMRVTELDSCLKHDLDLPIADSLTEQNSELYYKFKEDSPSLVHMSYLCKDKDYNPKLKGINMLDFLTWLGFYSLRIPIKQIRYCSTPNSKYNLIPWFQLMGRISLGNSFIHPVVSQKHELVFMHEISDLYWRRKYQEYSWILDNENRRRSIAS